MAIAFGLIFCPTKSSKISATTSASARIGLEGDPVLVAVAPMVLRHLLGMAPVAEVDYADALGQQPILLILATPQFCQSRVCGPTVDIAEEVKAEFGDRAAFIHMEIFNANDPNKGLRPQVRAFGLPTEPWAFVIDREGVVRERLEGAYGATELSAALQKVVG